MVEVLQSTLLLCIFPNPSSVTSSWQLESGRGGNIYTTEVGKYCIYGFSFLSRRLLNIYQLEWVEWCPGNSYVYILVPGSCEYDLIWSRTLQVKLRFLTWDHPRWSHKALNIITCVLTWREMNTKAQRRYTDLRRRQNGHWSRDLGKAATSQGSLELPEAGRDKKQNLY